jgi:hypothetical protein
MMTRRLCVAIVVACVACRSGDAQERKPARTAVARDTTRSSPKDSVIKGGDGTPVQVRYPEATTHGFLEMRNRARGIVVHGELLQRPRNGAIESRMLFHFADGSLLDEVVTFTQRGIFAMREYHLIQRGPLFTRDLDATLSASGDYTVKVRKDGKDKVYTGHLDDMPPDVYNGMLVAIAKNLHPREKRGVHMVAFLPEPKMIEVEYEPSVIEDVYFGKRAFNASRIVMKPKLGTVTGFLAKVTGKMPPNSEVWIITDQIPAFVRARGPLLEGNDLWEVSLSAPTIGEDRTTAATAHRQ